MRSAAWLLLWVIASPVALAACAGVTKTAAERSTAEDSGTEGSLDASLDTASSSDSAADSKTVFDAFDAPTDVLADVPLGAPEASVSDAPTDAPVVEAGPPSHPWGVDVPYGNIVAIAVDSLGDVVAVGGPNYYVTSIGTNGLQKWTQIVNYSSEAIGVAVDASNGVYVTGYAAESIDLGGSTPMPTGYFIVKYDVSGNFVWQLGPFVNANFVSRCAFFAANGDLVVGGSLTGTQDFGGGSITPAGTNDALLLEVTPAGGYVNAPHWGGTGGYDSVSVCTDDAAGNVYIGGKFEETIDFGGGPMTGPPAGNSSWNIFVAKLDASGAYAAQTQLSTSCDNCWVAGFVPDGAGNVFVAGTIDGPFSLDGDGGTLKPPGGEGAWLGELNASLGYVWGTLYADGDIARVGAFGRTTAGNLIIGATYTGNMSFGCGTLPVPPQGQPYAALVEFDVLGNCVPNYPFPVSTASINALANAAPPDVIIGGNFGGSLPLPSGSLTSHMSQTGSDGFVARLQP